MDEQETNLFILLAEGMWARGEDGEVLARHLAKAFAYVVKEGRGEDEIESEFKRFLSE